MEAAVGMHGVRFAVSTVHDGAMRDKAVPHEQISRNRSRFLEQSGTSPEQAVLVQLSYDSNDFCRYRTVGAAEQGAGLVRGGFISDALLTTEPNVALFLPLADCIGAVLYDPKQQALMVSHLGRHNLEQNGGIHSVRYMQQQSGSKPENIQVWLSPAAGKKYYPLFAFAGKSLHEVAREQLLLAGILDAHIEQSTIDTTTNQDYFSHSEFLQGNRASNGRHALVAFRVANRL